MWSRILPHLKVAEQTIAEGAVKLCGSLPFVKEAAALEYEGVRSAAYVGLIGLLADYLLRHELHKPAPTERKAMRRQTWQEAMNTVGNILPHKD